MSTNFSSVTALAQVHIDTSCPSRATARVAVVGEVDLATAPVLRDRLLGVLHDQAPAVLVVDLAGVTFLDCAGVGVLVNAHNVAVQTGRQMRVTNPQPIVRRVLEVTGLLGVFTAPIDRPEPLPQRSEYRSGPEPTPETVAEPHRVMAAA